MKNVNVASSPGQRTFAPLLQPIRCTDQALAERLNALAKSSIALPVVICDRAIHFESSKQNRTGSRQDRDGEIRNRFIRGMSNRVKRWRRVKGPKIKCRRGNPVAQRGTS